MVNWIVLLNRFDKQTVSSQSEAIKCGLDCTLKYIPIVASDVRRYSPELLPPITGFSVVNFKLMVYGEKNIFNKLIYIHDELAPTGLVFDRSFPRLEQR